jgi:phage tail-like protein
MSALELPRLLVDSVAVVVSPSRLALVNRDPGPDEHAVPVDATIGLEVVDTGSSTPSATATRVWIDGVMAFDGVAIVAPFAGSRASISSAGDALRLVFEPQHPLTSLATVSVRVVSATADGAASIEETYRFVVEDRTAPRLVAAQAVGQRSVRLGFDEPVEVVDPSLITIVATTGPAVPVRVVSATSSDASMLLALDTEMTPDVEHEVVVSGVSDRLGNPVLGPFDRARFVGFRAARPTKRNFDLWRMLPRHNRRDDQTGDLARFIACLQEVTDLLLADSDRWPDIFDHERAPEAFLDRILEDLGNPFPFELDERGKRRLASVLVAMYGQKGTAKGIRNAIRFFLGIDITAITAFNADALTLGESQLGIDWVLGPSGRFALYAFNIEVARVLTTRERLRLRAIVEYLKPAHTHFVDLVEPLPAVVRDHWEIGVSEVGVTTVTH